jgi:hypothetical protein
VDSRFWLWFYIDVFQGPDTVDRSRRMARITAAAVGGTGVPGRTVPARSGSWSPAGLVLPAKITIVSPNGLERMPADPFPPPTDAPARGPGHIRGKVAISLRCRGSRNDTRAVRLGAMAGGDDEGDAGQRPGSGHLAEQREPGG